MNNRSLFSTVQKHGFSLITIPSSTALQLEESLKLFKRNETFRFPPPEGFPYPEWPGPYRESYTNLIGIAKDCFKTLLIELKDCNIDISHTDRAKHILSLHDNLDYSKSSFMNLFNYNFGHLAPHQDRCLVTIVYTQQLDTSRSRTSCLHKNLWCLEPDQEAGDISKWTSIDKLVAIPGNQHSVCLHVGEELSALYNFQIPAALHCVLADPTILPGTPSFVAAGDSINMPRQAPPGSGSGSVEGLRQEEVRVNNRLSAALILSASEVSAIVEEMMQDGSC